MTTDPAPDQISRGDIVTLETNEINYIYLGSSYSRSEDRKHELFPLIFNTPDNASKSHTEKFFQDVLTQESARDYISDRDLMEASILDNNEIASELSLMDIKACSELGEAPELDVVLDQLLFTECK